MAGLTQELGLAQTNKNMRRKIVVANWKMNNDVEEAADLFNDIIEFVGDIIPEDVGVVIAPPFVYTQLAVEMLEGLDQIALGAQDVSEKRKGAFTGEVSALMLASIGVDYAMIGHSERRMYHHETSENLTRKFRQCQNSNITPIFCFGESLEDRRSGSFLAIVKEQISSALFDLEPEAFQRAVLAYEPVWAIGTGETASPEQAQEVHAFVRELVATKYGQAMANQMTIIYGGSCNPSNAKNIFSQPDVDGGLIGGASLAAKEFAKIIKAL
jgi:triosephosphate isomerase